ncbi:alpha/beta fold hydrolase [Sphingomonas sp. 22176]|uniref:alpha/beta fold hydrolase n=1 Tax=Sphingomonas sp. 22176 TaxID=3453884 RepID=UPI003F8350DC
MAPPDPVLGEFYRITAPDLRGYGETDKHAGGHDKRTMARDLAELLDALGSASIASHC